MAVPLVVHLLLAASLVAPILIKLPQTLEPGVLEKNWLLVVFGSSALLPITGTSAPPRDVACLFRLLLHRIASHPAEALSKPPAPLQRNLTAQLASSGGLAKPYPRVAASALQHLAAANQAYAEGLRAPRRGRAVEVPERGGRAAGRGRGAGAARRGRRRGRAAAGRVQGERRAPGGGQEHGGGD